MEEYWDTLQSALNEYLMALTVQTHRADEGCRQALAEQEALRRAHPWLEELYDLALVRAVPREEYPALQEFLILETDLAARDRCAAYCRGLYDAIGFLRQAGVL